MTQSLSQTSKIGLALSGGGVRAVAFHAGVLLWLAEHKQLEKVHHISSVSGGSLFTGLVFHTSDYNWPTSDQYLNEVYPHIKEILTHNSLQWDAIGRLFLNPKNWKFMFSRANVLAQSIEDLWGIKGILGDVPHAPVWSINGTTAENGKRFRFKNSKGGDYEIGYADFRDFKLSKAMAVSAAFPGGIGPLVLETNHYKWMKRKSWDSPGPPLEFIPSFKRIHLYDGGLYDNLGIEPLFDVGQRTVKSSAGDVNFIMVSDAGYPLDHVPIENSFKLLRLKRFMDIVMEQTRALRVRGFVNFLKNNPSAGMYLQMGSIPSEVIKKNKLPLNDINQSDLDKNRWLSSGEIETVSSMPTTLSKMTTINFDMAVKHGYETANWNYIAFN